MTDLLPRLAEAIAAEADKPRAERVGLAHVMIAVVQPDLDARDAEIRRLTADVDMWRRTVTRTEQGRDRVIADNDRLTAELQQARQQTAARIATEIRQYCPDHGEADTCRIDCHCAIADEITRLYTTPVAVSGA